MLMAASERNATACVDWMLESGVDCNAINDDGSTAFHYACAFGSLHCIASLLKNNCRVDIEDVSHGVVVLCPLPSVFYLVCRRVREILACSWLRQSRGEIF